MLEARLLAYVDHGSPADEPLLAERCAFELEVRALSHPRAGARLRLPARFPKMPRLWVDFVNQNRAAESSIARLNVRRAYEVGRCDATEAANEGWASVAKTASPVPSETFDPIAMIDRLVQDAVAQRVAQLVPAILGHAGDVRGRYGRKGILDPQIAAKIEALEPPVIKQMRERERERERLLRCEEPGR